MSRRDATVVLLAVGLLGLYVGISDRILTFLRPQMRPYLVLSGSVLTIVALVTFALDRRSSAENSDGGEHDVEHHERDDVEHHEHRASRAGWMLLIPMFVAVVVAPGTLGSWAADRQRGVMFAGTYDFDLGPFLQAHAVAGTEPEMRLLDFNTAAADVEDRVLLGDVTVRLTGFVNRLDDGSVLLDRFVVGCCVADAALLEVYLDGVVPPEVASETWVRVSVRFDTDASPSVDQLRNGKAPVAHLADLESIDAPDEPYEYLYG